MPPNTAQVRILDAVLNLCRLQQTALTHLNNLRQSSRSTLPSCLVYGGRGSGKRTTVHALANTLDFNFSQANVGDEPSFVRQRLFGTHREAERASDLSAPGECGTDEGTILYLFGLENLDKTLHQEIHRLITGRKYVDALGREWRLSDWIWLIGAIHTTDRTPSVVNLHHWLCTAFEHKVHIDMCDDEEAIRAICQNIAAEFGHTFEETSNSPIFSEVRRTSDRLHALRRWISSVSVSDAGSQMIQADAVQKEMLKDIQTVLGQLRYRQQSLHLTDLERWQTNLGRRSRLHFTSSDASRIATISAARNTFVV